MINRIPLVARAIVECQSLLVRCTRRFHFDKGLAVMGWPILRSVPGSRVSVGRNFMMVSASSFSAVGVSHPCVINALRAICQYQTSGNDVGIVARQLREHSAMDWSGRAQCRVPIR